MSLCNTSSPSVITVMRVVPACKAWTRTEKPCSFSNDIPAQERNSTVNICFVYERLVCYTFFINRRNICDGGVNRFPVKSNTYCSQGKRWFSVRAYNSDRYLRANNKSVCTAMDANSYGAWTNITVISYCMPEGHCLFVKSIIIKLTGERAHNHLNCVRAIIKTISLIVCGLCHDMQKSRTNFICSNFSTCISSANCLVVNMEIESNTNWRASTPLDLVRASRQEDKLTWNKL